MISQKCVWSRFSEDHDFERGCSQPAAANGQYVFYLQGAGRYELAELSVSAIECCSFIIREMIGGEAEDIGTEYW